MRSILFFCLSINPIFAFHFYLTNGEKKCFFEELPANTLLALKYYSQVDVPSEVSFEFTVMETFDNDHVVVTQKAAEKGDFTFTSLDSGEHKFCIGAFSDKKDQPIRVFMDLVIGNSGIIDAKKMDQVGYLLWKINDLNSKTEEVKREQMNIREREAAFRDQSELVNARVVRWTLFQITVLLGMGAWQMKHLKSFFIKEKVV